MCGWKGYTFLASKYMNGSCFSLRLVYEWGGVRGLRAHVRTQNHGKLPPWSELQQPVEQYTEGTTPHA